MIRTLCSALFVFGTQPLLATEVLTTELYNDKGLAGQIITTVADDKNQTVEFKLEWNNRRVSITKSYQLDDQGRLFSLNMGGFMKAIRQGWGLENFEKLKIIADESENQYYQDLSAKLTHRIDTPLLIKNTRVIDVVTRKALENHDVLIENETITRVAKGIEAPANAKIIDGTGKSLIPGLWDMHGHLSKTDAFTYLPAGVTSVRDIGNSPENMEEIEQLYRNELLGTHVYKSGFIDRESEYSAGLGFTEDGRRGDGQALSEIG